MQERVIIDVRTPAEYHTGHIEGSINIPLQEIPYRMEEIKSFNLPLLIYCASGIRSRQATAYLKESNIDCENGGTLKEVIHQFRQQNPMVL